MSLAQAPTNQPIVSDKDGFLSFPWLEFFDSLSKGDAGFVFTPIVANLTIVGGIPSASGRVYRISSYLSIFVITINPPANGNTSGVAGSTAITNFPFKMNGNGVCFAVSGLLGTVTGMCDQASNRIYPPSWSNVTVPLTIIGIVEAS